MSQSLDIYGRAVGGLFQACNATNTLHKQRRLEYRYLLALETGGKTLAGTGLILHGNVLCAPHNVLTAVGSSVVESTVNINGQVQQGRIVGGANNNGMEEELVPEKKRRKKGIRGVRADASASSVAVTQLDSSILVEPSTAGVSGTGDLSPVNVQSTPSGAKDIVAAPTSGRRGKQSAELYCVCKTPWTADKFMIGCDGECADWFHPECLGYSTSKKKDTTLVDVDGVKFSDIDNYRFFCPWCEITRGAMGGSDTAERRIPTGNRYFRWCDVADVGDACESSNEDLGKDNQAALRWKILMQARNYAKIMGPCIVCKRCHHPLLPCPASAATSGAGRRAVSPRMDEPEIPEESTWTTPPVKLFSASSESFGLVVAGKYQSFHGQVVSSSKKWYLLSVPGVNGMQQARIIVPHNQLLISKVKPFVAENEANIEDEPPYLGVMPTPNGPGFIAYLDLDGEAGNRIFLGRFSSKIRAARVHDIAKRLQFGDDNLTFEELNFTDLSKLMITPPTRNQPSTEWDQAVALAHQLAMGPFASMQHLSNTDALYVLDWSENLASSMEQLPPYFAKSYRLVNAIIDAVISNAKEIAGKQKSTLEKVITANATEEEEDELEVIIKKYSRSRNAKQQRQRNNS